jgi:hypothetical protein
MFDKNVNCDCDCDISDINDISDMMKQIVNSYYKEKNNLIILKIVII